jgi:hypothetical protein
MISIKYELVNDKTRSFEFEIKLGEI